MSHELASMLKEIEDVIRKYRVRLENGSESIEQPVTESPEVKRFRILKFVSENQPVKAFELYEKAGELGMSRQGLGGFFREAAMPDDSGPKSSSLNRVGDGPYAEISIGRYGVLQLDLLQRKHGPITE